VLYLATSKYGNIRLGEGKVEYSTLLMAVYVYLRRSRLLHAVLGRCRMGLLLPDPGLNIAPQSPKALNTASLLFLPLGRKRLGNLYLASLIMAYHFHAEK
jgi:BCCT family betaine/carnitine transporter